MPRLREQQCEKDFFGLWIYRGKGIRGFQLLHLQQHFLQQRVRCVMVPVRDIIMEIKGDGGVIYKSLPPFS